MTERQVLRRRWAIRSLWAMAFIGAILLPEMIFDALRGTDQARDPLAAIEQQLRERYDFPHISGESLRRMQATASAGTSDGPVVFDVRQAAEHAVSHIDGAIQVDPAISAVDFMAQYGALVAGRDVVFYCSVGRRAVRLAARVEKPVAAAGTRVHNLSGGIFRWHGEERPLVTAEGVATDQVHMFNRSVGSLMPRPQLGVIAE